MTLRCAIFAVLSWLLPYHRPPPGWRSLGLSIGKWTEGERKL